MKLCDPTPTFRPWRSPLGWSFTVDEMEQMHLAMIEAAQYFATKQSNKITDNQL